MRPTSLVARTEEQRLIAESVASIADTYGHDYWRECCASGAFVEELWSVLGEEGYLGVTVPEAYGGAGMGLPELATLIESFAAHGVPLLDFLSTTTMAPLPILEHGSERLKERYLPGIASGDQFAFAITEPHSGTNAYRIRTEARREGDEYVVDGEKTYITGARDADYVQLVVRTTPYDEVAESDPRQGGTLLVVDADSEGIETSPMDIAIPEPSRQYAVYFDDVRVPVENRIGAEGEGFQTVFEALNPERVVTAALAVGLGRYALDIATEYARDRVVFDGPIGSYQGVQHPLARAKVQLELAALALEEAARAYEDDAPGQGAYANVAKYAASEAADGAMDAAVQTLGGRAFDRSAGLVDLRNWTRFLRIAPVNNEMVLNYVGENLLGLPKSY